jgi:hypothetical protein
MNKDKKAQADKISQIEGKVQDLYFELEDFHEHDVGSSALTTTIKLMDSIVEIRKRILQGGIEIIDVTTVDGPPEKLQSQKR